MMNFGVNVSQISYYAVSKKNDTDYRKILRTISL